jgi:branched-chain amino acid aminotransferase
VIRDGVVLTPPADAGCLLGVTRAVVLELCADHGMPSEEVALGPAALGDADEAFLTSSTREVQPIGRVDGRALPAAPGPTSDKIAALLTELIARVPDP